MPARCPAMVLKVVGAATLSVVLVGTSLALAGAAAAALPDGTPFAGLWVGALVALGALVATRRPSPALRLATILSWLSLAPLLWLGAAWTVGRPLVVSHWVCGTGMVGILVLAPFVVAGLPAVATLVLGAVIGGRWPRVRPLRVALTTVAVAATLFAALTWSLSVLTGHDGVEPDRWLSSLPVVERVETTALGDTLGPFDVTLEEEGGTRYASFAPRGAPAEGYAERFVVQPGSVVTLRRSVTAGIWILEIDEHTRRALRDGDTAFSDVQVDDVRAQLAIPPAYQHTAAAGAALALLLLALAWRAGRPPRWLASARPATVADDSLTLRFEDGALPARGVASSMLPPGPALVLGPPGLPGYRTDGATGPLEARSGTADEVLGRAETRAAALAGVALLSATLASCPLLAALYVLG